MSDSQQHMTCNDIVDLVTDYLERSLPAGEATLFEQHLNFCDGCALYVGQIRRTVETVGRIEPAEVPPDVRDRLLTAFRDWKRT